VKHYVGLAYRNGKQPFVSWTRPEDRSSKVGLSRIPEPWQS